MIKSKKNSSKAFVIVGALVALSGCRASTTKDLDTKSFKVWTEAICKQAACQPQEVRSLIPYYFESTPSASKSLKIVYRGQIYFLLHNFNSFSPEDLKVIAFLPGKIEQAWTISQMTTVAKWMEQLVGGQVDTKQMRKCVTDLKNTGYPRRRLGDYGDPQRLNAIFMNGQVIATGDCWWLPHKKNVAFGFMGQ